MHALAAGLLQQAVSREGHEPQAGIVAFDVQGEGAEPAPMPSVLNLTLAG